MSDELMNRITNFLQWERSARLACGKCDPSVGHVCEWCYAVEILAELKREVNRRRPSPWTRVADKPVPTDGPYLVFIPDEGEGQILIGEAGAGVHLPWETWRNYDDDENKEYAMKMFNDATHWMPIPKPEVGP